MATPETTTSSSSTPEYTVHLEAFEGPMDLLMYLIRRAEVNIIDIPIARITDQYIAYLNGLERVDVELAGEFLVMAAILMEIKSRMLVPPEKHAATGNGGAPGESALTGFEGNPASGDLDASDPRYELVRQLLAYKKFRDAALNLEQIREQWHLRVPLSKPAIDQSASHDEEVFHGDDADAGAGDGGAPRQDETRLLTPAIEDLGVWDLFEVFQRIIEAVDFGRLGDHQVKYDDTPILLHQEDLMDQIGREAPGALSFRRVLLGRTRSEAIGLFLAILELVRLRRVIARQDRPNDDIVLESCSGTLDDPQGAGDHEATLEVLRH